MRQVTCAVGLLRYTICGQNKQQRSLSSHSMTVERSAEKNFKLRCKDTLLSSRCKERYARKFQLANGKGQYERTQKEWEYNIDLWHSITYMYVCVCMFIILYHVLIPQILCLITKAWKALIDSRMGGWGRLWWRGSVWRKASHCWRGK